jgi:hypothetical protein
MFGTALPALAQAPARTKLIGAVTAADAGANTLTLKTDAGEQIKVSVAPTAKLLRLDPKELDRTKTQTIQFSDVAVGDRVRARSVEAINEIDKSMKALEIIDMSGVDLAKQHQQEQQDWQKRGVAGVLTAKDEQAGTMTVKLPAMMGQGELVKVLVTPKTVLKRYAPDSVKYADAKPSTLVELSPGDQVRALGNRDEAAGTVQAEQIVSGAFTTIAAAVLSVDAAAGVVRAKNLDTGKPVNIKITAESNLRRMPQMGQGGGFGGGMGGAQGGGGASGGQRPAGGPGWTPGGAAGGPGGGPGGQRRGGDLTRYVDFMPKIGVDAVKSGETIVVLSSKSGKADEMTAIIMLAGADSLVAIAQQRAAQSGRSGMAGGPSLGMNLDVMSMVPAQ